MNVTYYSENTIKYMEQTLKQIGYIDEKRLINIPPNYRSHHEFCFYLYDCMVGLLKQIEIQKAGHVSFKIESEIDHSLLESGVHILDFLDITGKSDIERRAIVNHVCIALYSDMLNFIYEGLRALEKRKFSVAFALFRKPFKEGLLIVAQMCADENTFFSQLKFNVKNVLNRNILDKPGIISLLESALASCKGHIFFKADDIFESIFNRKNKVGMAELFDKATHLITDYSQIQTDNYNLNFIFKNPMDNDVYEGGTYSQLATILLLLNTMLLELYSRMADHQKWHKNYVLLTALGIFESLFMPGKSRMAKSMNHTLSDLLQCPVCQAKLKIKKRDIPRFFIMEMLDCKSCHTSHHFPFGWLMSRQYFDINP